MPSTTPYEKWDVVLVSFPFSDFTAAKRRPVVVISPTDFNTANDPTILFVTSRVDSARRPGDYELLEWRKAGFPKPSLVRMKFATVHRTVIIKKFGNLAAEDRNAIEQNLLEFFTS